MREIDSLNDLDAGPNESLVLPLNGRAKIEAGEGSHGSALGPRDAFYLPPRNKFSLRKLSKSCDIIWAHAPAKATLDHTSGSSKIASPATVGASPAPAIV
jgi:hypothetical protein